MSGIVEQLLDVCSLDESTGSGIVVLGALKAITAIAAGDPNVR